MERNPGRHAGVILLVIFGLLIAYPASVGPAAFLYQYLDWGSFAVPLDGALGVIYDPLFNFPDPIGTWACEWWNYGGDLGAELY